MNSRKLILFLLVLAVLVVILGVVRRFESNRTPGWQSELEQYLLISQRSLSEIRIISVVEAANPQNFTPDQVTAVPTDWTWEGISEIPHPTAVKCVRLESNSLDHEDLAGHRRWEVVLLGYHDDGLWHSGWVVHEIKYEVSEQDLQELLVRLGCDLGLDNLQASTAQPDLDGWSHLTRYPF
jgi:hypothetical protein